MQMLQIRSNELMSRPTFAEKHRTIMKTTFTLDQVKELLSLAPEQQKQIIEYGDALANASNEEIATSAIEGEAPKMIRDLHRRSVRRARAAIARRNRIPKPKQKEEVKAEAVEEVKKEIKKEVNKEVKEETVEESLDEKAERYLQWFRKEIIPEIMSAVRERMYVVGKVFAKLTPAQIAAVSSRAYKLLTQYIRRAMEPLLNGAQSA